MATHSTPNNRSTAVTGARGGLGREVAVQLARMGYRVFGICQTDAHIRNQDHSTPLPVILRPRGGGGRVAFAMGTERRGPRGTPSAQSRFGLRDGTRARSAP